MSPVSSCSVVSTVRPASFSGSSARVSARIVLEKAAGAVILYHCLDFQRSLTRRAWVRARARAISCLGPADRGPLYHAVVPTLIQYGVVAASVLNDNPDRKS